MVEENQSETFISPKFNMTETRQYIAFGDVEKFLVKSYKRVTGGREFDIDKYAPYVDAVRHVLVPSLENQILFFLERFVYNKDFQQSSYQRYLDTYKESMLTAYAQYNDIGTSIEAIRDSLTIDHMIDFLGHSLLTNSRIAKISDDLNAMGIERNWLGYVNVFNYINEKDFWVCSSSSSYSLGGYSSICAPSNDNILSQVNEEKGFHVVERTRGHKRPRKRAATHISRKHYKLERLAQLSDRSFRVTESLYDLLRSNWVLHDSLYTKRKLKRNCGELRRSRFANYHRNHRKIDWKNENLMLFIRKMNCAGIRTIDDGNERHSEIKTSSSLPCRVEQLLSKLARVDPSLTRFHCNFIQNKFQTKLYNVCSCLNNLLSRMDVKTINSIYLVCEIRKDYLNFKLKQTAPSKCNSSLFATRVMTCEALYRHGIRNTGSRQKLKSQSFWAAKKANEISTGEYGLEVSGEVCQCENIDFKNNRAISSIEITFDDADHPQNIVDGLTCDTENLEGLMLGDSSSISDVIQKLELSPFRFQETEQSFRIRSKIRDIVRSIMICTQAHLPPGQEGEQSISIQAIISTPSLQERENCVGVLPVESKSLKALSLSEMVSFIESKIYSLRSGASVDCQACAKLKKSMEPEEYGNRTGSAELKKSVIPKSCLGVKEQRLRSRGLVRPNKSPEKLKVSLSSRESTELKNKNKYKICTNSKMPVRSEEFTTSYYRRPLCKKIVESIASEISNALTRTKSNVGRTTGNGHDYDIDVTVEIEDSCQSSDNVTESVSRHTHIFPSMKSVGLGTSSKYFPYRYDKLSSPSSSSSESEVLMFDNFTTMNKSMTSRSDQCTISSKSHDRIKHLIREKVRKKLSETDSRQSNSSKTTVSSGKYYLSIPSSKTNRPHLKSEIPESSSISSSSLQLPVYHRHQWTKKSRTSSSDDESSLSNKSSDYRLSNSTHSSRAATFDKNSIYGCIEDRLANRYFKDIVNDYSDEARDSPGYEDIKSQISYEQLFPPDDHQFRSDERENHTSRYYEDISEENETGFSQESVTDNDACTNISWTNDGIERSYQCCPKQKSCTSHIIGRAIVQGTPRFHDYERFENVERTRRASGWSTCTIRPSRSRDCLEIYPSKSHCRFSKRDRGYSQQKNFAITTSNIMEKYKARFQNIDRRFRAKLQRYVGFCKNVKSNFEKQFCLDDFYQVSKTSISSSDSKRHGYNGVCFGG